MSQGSRPSYLDYAEDNDDVLNKSWDVESRHRLQENALALNLHESKGAEVFQARVELGLHELTAALSSLRYRDIWTSCILGARCVVSAHHAGNRQYTHTNTTPPRILRADFKTRLLSLSLSPLRWSSVPPLLTSTASTVLQRLGSPREYL